MKTAIIQSWLSSLVFAAGNGLFSNSNSNNNNIRPSPIASNPIVEQGDSYNPFAPYSMDYPAYLGYRFGYNPDYRWRPRRKSYPYYPAPNAYRSFLGRNRARPRPYTPAYRPYRPYRPTGHRHEGVNRRPNYFADDYSFVDANSDIRSLPSAQHGCAPLIPKGGPRPRPYPVPRNYHNWAYSDSSSSSDEETFEYVWEY